jgi:hypothetical protein
VIALLPHQQGTILPVRAQPRSRRNEIRGLQAGALKVCVTPPAEKGKANQALIQVLSEALGLRKSQIELLSGETTSQKRFLVRDLTAAALAARIEAVLRR